MHCSYIPRVRFVRVLAVEVERYWGDWFAMLDDTSPEPVLTNFGLELPMCMIDGMKN